MIYKKTLQDKQVVFRLVNLSTAYVGTVRGVENDGFWIESPTLIGQLRSDMAWKTLIEQVEKPLILVPTSSLMYLIASDQGVD
jgi:hypothetical protein